MSLCSIGFYILFNEIRSAKLFELECKYWQYLMMSVICWFVLRFSASIIFLNQERRRLTPFAYIVTKMGTISYEITSFVLTNYKQWK